MELGRVMTRYFGRAHHDLYMYAPDYLPTQLTVSLDNIGRIDTLQIVHDYTYHRHFTLDARPWIVFKACPCQKKVSRYLKFNSGLHFRLPTRNSTAIIALYCSTSRMPRSSKGLGYGQMRKFELERGRLHSALRGEVCIRKCCWTICKAEEFGV